MVDLITFDIRKYLLFEVFAYTTRFMKQTDAIKILNKWDKRGRYVFRKKDLGFVLASKDEALITPSRASQKVGC